MQVRIDHNLRLESGEIRHFSESYEILGFGEYSLRDAPQHTGCCRAEHTDCEGCLFVPVTSQANDCQSHQWFGARSRLLIHSLSLVHGDCCGGRQQVS